MKKSYKKVNFGMGIYLPEQILDNAELERRRIILRSGKQLRAEGILEKIGVERRHIAADSQTVADMGYLAVCETLVDDKNIDLIIASSSHPTNYNVSSSIAKRIGANKAQVLDIHAACSGSPLMFSYILDHAKTLQGKNALLVATEKFSRSVVDLRRPDLFSLDSSLGQTIFGDGAAAIRFVVGRDIVIHSALNKALPDKDRQADLIVMAMGENKFIEPCNVYPVAGSPKQIDFPMGYFTQNGPRVFESVLKSIPEYISTAVKQAGFSSSDIDLVILHPGSKRLFDALSEALSPRFKTYSDYADGNMSSVSLLYSFIKAVREKRIGRGSKIVLSGFGAGSPNLYSSTVVIELG